MTLLGRAPRALLAAFLGVTILGVGLGVPGSTRATARGAESPPPPVRVAIEHARDQHRTFGLRRADVTNLIVTDVYRSPHNGVTHVYLRQTVDSLEVARANMTVNIMRDGTIISVGSRFMKDLAERASGSVRLDALAAAKQAARHLGLSSITPPRLTSVGRSADRRGAISWPGVSISPVPVQLTYYPTDDGVLRLAWQLEIEEVSEQHWWQIAIDAETGELLSKVDYVNQHAEQDHDEPHREAARQKKGDGAAYRVFALPLESPSEGERTVPRNPADKKASPFGWHDTDGQAGHDFTTTRGNNVHAYADYTPGANTPLPTMDADGGDDLNFDFDLDFSEPPHLWRDAAVTNLFYWNNVIHDIAFRYGFT
ncbi:MAG: M36 family metallopeptidase, partial [Actinomycetota bacterium]